MPAPRRASTKQRLPRARLGSRLLRPPPHIPVELRNDFEGANGVAVTTGNSGGGGNTAFTAVNGDVTYDTSRSVTGSSSLHAGVVSGATSSSCEWLNTVFVTSPPSWYGRFYFRLPSTAFPSGATPGRIYQVNAASSVARWGIGPDSNGNILVRDAFNGLTRLVSDAFPATQTWHRCEFHAVWDGANLTVTVRLFLGANLHGTTADEEKTSSTWADSNAAVEHEWGLRFTSVASPWDVHVDAIGLSDSDWLGPAVTPVTLADAGSANDSVQVAAQVPLADAGGANDSLAVATQVPLAEQGQGADGLSVDTGAGGGTVARLQDNEGNVGATRQTSVTVSTTNPLTAGSVVTVELTSNNAPTFTPPDGTWTSIVRQANGTAHVAEAFRHEVQAGEVGGTGGWVFSVGATTRSICWHVTEWGTVDTANPISGTPTSVIASAAAINIPAITVDAGAAVVYATAFSGASGQFSTYTPPDGTWTELADQHTAINPPATDSSESVGWKSFASAGSTGTITVTASTGTASVGLGYALKPAAGGIPKTLPDAGQVTDAVLVAAQVPLADVAAAVDQVQVTAAVPLADAGAAADSLQVTAQLTLPDSGAATDAVFVPTTRQNTFEGGSDGTTISTANSGGASGQAFDIASAGTGTTLAYEADRPAHGSLGMLVATGATAATATVGWTVASLPTTQQWWHRFYWELTAAPATTQRIARFAADGTLAAALRVNASRQLQIADAANVGQGTMTTAITVNSRVRVEWRVLGHATAGEIEVRLWLTPDSTGAADETLLVTALNTFGAVNQVEGGWLTASTNVPAAYWDDFAASNITWVGPATQFTKTLPEQGTATDQVQVDAAVPLAEQGTDADSLQVAAQVPLPDAGAAQDTLVAGVPKTLTEQGPATDSLQVAAQVPLAEQGTGTDAVQVAAQVPLPESGTGADSVAAGIFKDLAEQGTATDQVQIQAQVPLSEQGTATDQLTVTAAVPLPDSGQGSDQIVIPKQLTEQGTGTDQVQVTAAVPLAEQGAAADSVQVTAAVPLTEQGAAADQVQVTQLKPLAEQGTATDQVQAAAQVPLPEQGAGSDLLAVNVAVLLSDSGQATDSLTVSQGITKLLSDQGTAVDALQVTAAVPLAEQGTAVESLRAVVQAALTDAGIGAETLTAQVALALAERGAGTDALAVLTVAVYLRTSSREPTMTGTSSREPAMTGTSSREPVLVTSSREQGNL
jgi:hypothetical protein